MKNLGLVVAACVAALAVGCGSKSDSSPATLHVSGTVNPQSRSLSGARAVAIAADGRSYSAALSQSGGFKLDLPAGTAYRIVIANTTRTGQLRVVGHLVNPTTSGKISVISVKSGGTLALGTLSPAGTSSTSGTVKTASLASEKGEHEDDAENEDESKESDDDAKLCEDGDDVELEAEHAPGSDLDDASEKDAPKTASKSCDVHDADHDGDDD